jgi:uncharacterized protein YndB with AHSA1/START domain
MKALKIFFGIIVALALAFVFVGMMIPVIAFKTSVVVQRPVETTFSVFTDMDLIGEWLEGFESVELIEGEPYEVGSQFRFRLNDDGMEIEFTETLTAFEENEVYAFMIDADVFQNEVSFTFTGNGDETTIKASNSITGSVWYMRSILPFMKSEFMRQQKESLNLLGKVAEKAPPTIIGTWTGVDSNGGIQTFTFSRDGRATWRLSRAGDLVISGIDYTLSYETVPFNLDLSGFTSGPLGGKVLYGIVEYPDDNTMRFDAEAGTPDTDILRPGEFTSSTVQYVRAR